MASPATSLATLRPELAATFEEFNLEASRQRFIGHKVLPVIEMDVASGNFGKLSIANLLQDSNVNRAPRAGYNRQDLQFDDDNFATKEYGSEQVVDDLEANLYRAYFDQEMVVAKRTKDVVLRKAEQRIAGAVFNPATFNTTAVATEWSTLSTATPIVDVEGAVQNVFNNTGLIPNTLILPWVVFRNIRNNQQIIDRIKYSGRDAVKASDITTTMLADVFGLEQVLVGDGAKNTANEGQPSTLSSIWSNEYVMVCRVSDSPDFAEPCIGRVFHWGEDGSEILGHVESYREESLRGDVIRVRHQVDEKILYTALGELLSNITA